MVRKEPKQPPLHGFEASTIWLTRERANRLRHRDMDKGIIFNGQIRKYQLRHKTN